MEILLSYLSRGHGCATRPDYSILTISFCTPQQMAWHDSIVRMLTTQSTSSTITGIFAGIFAGAFVVVISRSLKLSRDSRQTMRAWRRASHHCDCLAPSAHVAPKQVLLDMTQRRLPMTCRNSLLRSLPPPFSARHHRSVMLINATAGIEQRI